MEREILFRGMDDNKRLIQGYFFQIWEDCFILWGTTNGVPNMTKVDPTTVGQFTGLCDKNGVKIFEGDLFVNPSNRLMVIETPINKPAFYALVVSDKTLGYPLIFENMSSREVIGNIHDTPDLAKEESE